MGQKTRGKKMPRKVFGVRNDNSQINYEETAEDFLPLTFSPSSFSSAVKMQDRAITRTKKNNRFVFG